MRIIVIGPQRSGTNITAAIIAKDTKLKLYSERDFGYSSCVVSKKPDNDLIQFITNNDNFVLQAPALNSYCHLIDTDALFVWVNRAADEIRGSRQRANWPGESLEAAKYRQYFDFDFTDTVEAAIKGWEIQRHIVPNIEVDYEKLSGHPLWKTERSNLSIGQT